MSERRTGAILAEWLKSQWTHALTQLAEINWIFAAAMLLIGVAVVCFAPEQARGYAIASATALFIAFVAYPWQKARDRANELGKEKREAYRRFFRATLDVRQVIFDAKFSSENEARAAVSAVIEAKTNYDGAVSELCISASQSVVAAAEKMHSAIYLLLDEWEKALVKLLQERSDTYSASDVSSVFEAVIQRHRKTLFDAENKIRNAMKSDEFGWRNSAVIEKRSHNEEKES